MPIKVQIRDEKCQPRGDPWWHMRSSDLLCQEKPGTTCLRFIDAYGDTTFNQLQLPVLLAELEQLRTAAPDAEAQQVLASLLTFLEAARDKVHLYVTFIGD